MAIRFPRGLSARTIYPSEAKVIAKRNIYTGEDLGRLGGPVHMSTIPIISDDDANDWHMIGPNGFVEVNLTGLFIPDRIVNTYTVIPGGVPGPPTSTSQWDTLARRLLLEFGTDGNEYYGANPDDRAVFDANTNTWLRVRGETPTDTPSPVSDNPVGSTTAQQDEPLLNGSIGPTGIQRLYESEMLLDPSSVNGPAASLSSAIQSALGQTLGMIDLTHAASMEVHMQGPVAAPGVVMLICHRYAVPTFSTEFFSGTYGLADQDISSTAQHEGLSTAQRQQVNRALSALYGGDMERVQYDIKYDTSYRGDWLRSELFGGDMFLEKPSSHLADLFDTTGGIFDLFNATPDYPTWLRPNGIVVGMKWSSNILTPYNQRSV